MFVLPDFLHCLRMTTSSVLGQLRSFGPNESMPPVAFVLLSSLLCIYTFLQAACKVKARGLEILFCRQSWSLLFFCCGQYLTLKSLSCLGETWVFVASLVKTGKHLVKGVNGKEERRGGLLWSVCSDWELGTEPMPSALVQIAFPLHVPLASSSSACLCIWHGVGQAELPATLNSKEQINQSCLLPNRELGLLPAAITEFLQGNYWTVTSAFLCGFFSGRLSWFSSLTLSTTVSILIYFSTGTHRCWEMSRPSRMF